jgi:hypothetical protein
VVAVVEVALLVAAVESGCWCEKMHLSLGVLEVAAVEVDNISANNNLVSHLCLSHL